MRTLLHTPQTRKRSIAAATLSTLALLGSLLAAAPAQALNDTGTGGVFVPTTGRILDTAKNIGGYSTAMPAKAWRSVTVAGNAGVPDDGSVGAVSVVATVADITQQGQLFGRPDADEPTTMMGIYGGEDKQNTSFSAVLAVNSDGTIQVQAETTARLILDVQGYYTANSDGTAPGGFVPINGKRIVDTRSGLGAAKTTLASGDRIDVQVTGTADVPAGASGVIVNLVAVNTLDHTGYLTPYAAGAARPSTSLNYAAGVMTSMQAQVKLSGNGKMTVYNSSSTTNLVVDVQGYFTAAGTGGASFTPGAGRAYDTRTGTRTPLAQNETRSIQVAGVAGVPVMGSGINAVVLTLTALKSTTGGGNTTVWADGTAKPNTTAINFDQTTIRTNTITVPLGANGKISLWNNAGPTDYVIDVQGWYANPDTPVISCDGFAANTWAADAPSEDVPCTVVTTAGTSSDDVLQISVDHSDAYTVGLSDVTVTSASALIPALSGQHVIEASRPGGAISTYRLGFGDWSKAAFSMNAAAPGSTGQPTQLDISGIDAVFPDRSRYAFFITDESGATVLQSDAIIDDEDAGTGHWDAPTDTLPADAKYFWHVVVSGPIKPGIDETEVSITSPDSALGVSEPNQGAPAPVADPEGQPAEQPSPTAVATIPPFTTRATRLCAYYDKNDQIHTSSTAQKNGKPTTSVHGWWTNVSCKGAKLKARVKTRLQQNQGGVWRTVGTEGSKRVYSSDGRSSQRSNGRYDCVGSSERSFRAVVVVKVDGVEPESTGVSRESTQKCN